MSSGFYDDPPCSTADSRLSSILNRGVLVAYERENPRFYKSFFGLSPAPSADELSLVRERVAFMRFRNR